MSDNGSGNTLGGGPASDPPPSTWGRPSAPRIGRIGDWSSTSGSRSSSSSGRFATLSSLSSSNSNPVIPRPPIAADDDDDDDDGPPGEGESWFAGGERSGISIQNPNARENVPGGRMVHDILRRAAEMSAARSSQPLGEQAPSTAFRGGGHTLGSDEVESTFVPDPDAQPDEEEEEAAHRNITFWRNGFSIEGGAFYSYADPENERLLAEINTGRAPVSVLDVRPGQPVEVVVSKRTTEDYVPERRPFGGSGARLGSPVPDVTSMPGSFPAATSAPTSRAERASVTTLFEVDQTQPTTTVQIRLADGTRMPCRMNLTHTVGDIRSFINASRPENSARAYTIGTTFPNRTLENDRETIAEAGLANSVVVQRWV
ncbi:SEP-domain-containing protein [Imleria badia]|nr:SEP-domain-containing protein [Imleria badia]